MNEQYKDKSVLVTGASGGLGAEIAREMARRGARVVLVARRQDQLDQITAEITGFGGSAMACVCDLVNDDQASALIERIETEWGALDVLVNNAGKEVVAPLQAVRTKTARELFDLNVVSMAGLTRLALRILRDGGSVINMASTVGLRGAAGLSIYSATKGAVIALTRSLALELAPRRIRVNAVAPGIVRTDMSERMFKKYPATHVATLEAAHPLGFGSPIDVARAVAFLGSNEASWITGQTLVVDGGYSA